MRKSGQAALEFLMTYGWAILVVLVVIGALAYFGVLSPSALLPEKCTITTGLNCADHIVSDEGIAVKLQNYAGRRMIVREVVFSSDALAGNCSTGLITGVLENGNTKSFAAADPAACSALDADGKKKKYAIEVKYSWADSQSVTHSASGELLSRVEAGALIDGSGDGGYVGYGNDITGYWKFDESSGTQAADSSSSGNTGTLTNFACTTLDCNASSGWTSLGRSGNALVFDGSSDYVNAGNSASLMPSGAITLSAWVYPAAVEPRPAIIRGDPRSAGYSIGMGYGYLEYSLYTQVSMPLRRVGSLPTGAWTHIALTYDSANHTMIAYENGNVVDTYMGGSGDITYVSADTLIGGNNYYNPYIPWKGSIDEVRIYNRALSAEEINAIFSAG